MPSKRSAKSKIWTKASNEELSKTDLNSLLKKFYKSARKCNGSLYSKSSLVAIRYGISRYLQQEKGLKLIDDQAFCSANETKIQNVNTK